MNKSMEPTYPTNSLNFLRRLRSDTSDQSSTAERPPLAQHPATAQNAQLNNNHPAHNLTPNPSPLRLKILIIGAGLGGLAAAIALSQHHHSITILESAPTLGEVGAGIQIPPNSLRLLLQWGIAPYLEAKAVEPAGITVRRWKDGRAIGYTGLLPQHRERYGAPYWVVHRADLHGAMVRLAGERGVEIQTACHVVGYEEVGGAVTLADGRTVAADLVVAADGIKSIARGCIPGLRDIQPQMTPFAAYRATVDVQRMRSDPDTAWLVREGEPTLNLWVGDGRHVMTYTIASGKSFNMVLSHRDGSDPNTWPTDPEERLKQMRGYYQDWDPRLVKITHMIEKTMKWPLMTVPTSPRWLSASGRLLILGDAAHGMLPYMSQGAAMAVEDGAALAEALAFVATPAQLPRALEVWQKVRVQRSSQMQQASAINGLLWHFGDGPEQEARDESMRAEVVGEEIVESANQWSDPIAADWAYGYDACEEIRKEMQQQERHEERAQTLRL
jgi:salicylate hydroxylase